MLRLEPLELMMRMGRPGDPQRGLPAVGACNQICQKLRLSLPERWPVPDVTAAASRAHAGSTVDTTWK